MQKTIKTRSARLLALVLMLVMLVGLLSVSVLAADAKPTKITLVGSDEALAYEFVDYLTYAWEDIPRYKVTVPAGTQKVQLYGTVHIDSSSGSGYCNEDTIDQWPAPIDYWTTDAVGSASPYTIETRIDGTSDKPLTLVKKASYGDSSSAYFLQFVAGGSTGGDADASPAPTITTDLSTDKLSLDYYGAAQTLSVAAVSTEGTLTYQWQVSTTSAAEGFTDIADAAAASYTLTPSEGLLGDFWYRVAVTNTVSGKTPTTVYTSVLPVTVTSFLKQVTFTTGKITSTDYKFILKDASGYPSTANRIDLSGDYAVTTYITGMGDYTWEIQDTDGGATRTLGSGSIRITSDSFQNFAFYRVYVYAQQSGWTADDFTTEVKDANGNVMTPGGAYKFASYVAYPYMLAPGSYKYTITPSAAKAAEGYQSSAEQSKTLTASKGSSTWSTRLAQSVVTSFTVPKGAKVELFKPSASYTYGVKTPVTGTVDTTGAAADVYSFTLNARTKYIYHASGSGLLSNAGLLTASTSAKAFDLTETMQGSPAQISRAVTTGAADIRLGGVDYTGSLALTSGATAQLNPLRMFQLANSSTAGGKSELPLEPDYHYTVVPVSGSDVVSVDASGKITAKNDGVALVLVTYDALRTGDTGWNVTSNKLFSAIWPENTGVVVVEVGANASAGPAANMTIHSGANKLAGNKLDAEADVLYYLKGTDGAKYTFTPAEGSTVTLLRPTLSATAMTYSGSFGTTGVSVADDGKVTLTLTAGKNIVRISKDGADTYQVITAKEANVTFTNVTSEGQPIQPGDTVKIQLTDVYSPVNYMANLYCFYTCISYVDPADSLTVIGTRPTMDRTAFDAAAGDASRAITVKIPLDWDTSKPYTLTAGTILFSGNGKSVGSHRGDLTTMGTSVPYIANSNAFPLCTLPDITIPVQAAAEVGVTFNVTDDEAAAVSGCKIELYRADTKDSRTLETTDTNSTISLTKGDWTYTVTKDSYLTVSGKLTVSAAATVDVTITRLTGIRVKSLPTKTTYVAGATLDLTGFAVEGVTRSGAVDIDRKLVTVSPMELTTVGQQTITVTYGSLTTTFPVVVNEDIVTIETTLTDGITQKNSRRTFDVIARDGNGEKISVSEVKVTLNGSVVNYNWDDSVKTSYTLKFTQEGENKIVITARNKTVTYTINYIKAEEGEVVGQAVFALEAFTLGEGYIIEPTLVDIHEGENAAQMLSGFLKANGLDLTYTGSLESGFYMSAVIGDKIAEIPTDGGNIPAALLEKLDENGFTVNERSTPNRLGEFDYTTGSGWMYCLNNVFPNVGYADSYLSEGDVVRSQFTLAYGSDMGGGYAVGDSGYKGYFPVADKDDLTYRIAQINAEIEKNANYLEENGLTKAYNDAMDVLENLLSSQADVDAALAALNKTPDPKPEAVYTITSGSGSTVSVGQTANVTYTVMSDTASTYSAYALTVTYDSGKLTYTGINTDATVLDDKAGNLTVIGFGDDRTCGTDNLVLSFTAKAAGTASVTITSAKIDESGNASGADAPAANIAGGLTVIKVNYSVTLSDDFTGADTAEPGEDYIFSAKDPHYDYTFSAKMGDADAAVIDNGDGTYTINNVSGNLTITAAKTPKSYTVTVEGTGKDDVTAAAAATYQTAYSFTLTKDEAYTYDVTVTVDGTAYTPTLNADGKTYTIAGADVTGNIVITVNKTLKPVTTTAITFVGSGSGDVVGGTTQTAENGKDFTFTLNADDAYDYTVTLGGETLTPDADGKYTIAGDKLTGTALTVTVEKTAKQTAEVHVYEYVKLNGKNIYLVTASGSVADGKVMAYDGSAMFWSDKYQAYAYLVISDTELTKTEAAKKVTQASATKTSIAYDGDVNLTGKIDVNDAQLVWNMYNAKYTDFNTVSMRKFLEADLNGDHKLTTADAAAVITKMLG